MRRRAARGRRGRLTRLARWLGFDRNPLRRRTDRIETALRLVMIFLLVAAVPIAAIVVGRQADHAALRAAYDQQAAEHKVRAVLLKSAPTQPISDPYTSIETAWVPARWQPPGLPPRTGEVEAPVGAAAGSTVAMWVSASGAMTTPPATHHTIVGDVCIAVTLTCLASLLTLLLLGMLARRVLNHRRMGAWEAAWRRTGPLWSQRR